MAQKLPGEEILSTLLQSIDAKQIAATYIKALIERFHEKRKSQRRKTALNSNPTSRA